MNLNIGDLDVKKIAVRLLAEISERNQTIINEAYEKSKKVVDGLNKGWMMQSTTLTFLIQAGFPLVISGSIHSKN